MRQYWKYHFWEALLMLAVSCTALLAFSQGFYIPDRIADSVWLALLLCGVTLLYCYLGNYNRATMLCFSIVACIIAAGFFMWMRSYGVAIADGEESLSAVYIYWIAGPVISIVYFLLGRSRPGIAVLFVSGSLLFGVTAFLQFEVKTWWIAAFVLASIALYMLRQYRVKALGSSTVKPNFRSFFLMALVTALLAAAAACLVFFALIRPLEPPTMDIKLLTKYLSYETLERVGIAQQYPIPDELLRSKEQDGTQLNSDQEDEEPEEKQPEELSALPGEDMEAPESGSSSEALETLESVSYGKRLLPYIIAAVIVLLLLASVPFLRRWLRKRKLSSLCTGDGRRQILALYPWYLKKFGKIGFARAPSQTEMEYAAAYGERLQPYMEGAMDVGTLTGFYIRARYGAEDINKADCDSCAAIYGIFLKNYRALHGSFRYLLKYFVL